MLQSFLNRTNYTKVVDLGCGNWFLMRTIKIPARINYLGLDVVKSVIDENKARYTKGNVHFEEIGGLQDIVELRGDIIIAKDVLQHWPLSSISFFIHNILPNFRFGLITNDPCRPGEPNRDIEVGDHRCVDLQRPPFNLTVRELMTWTADQPKRVILWTSSPDAYHGEADPVQPG
jgi:SAM-dependent methyltransferase